VEVVIPVLGLTLLGLVHGCDEVQRVVEVLDGMDVGQECGSSHSIQV
jgi:hypothetical protein